MIEYTALRICEFLESISLLTGINVVFYWSDLQSQASISEKIRYHYNPFCMKVHKNPELKAKCNQTELADLVEKAYSEKKPFQKLCHAGVIEMVVPLHSYRGYEGVVLFGPFRNSSNNPIYESFLKEFYQLERYKGDYLEAFCKILSSFTSILLEYKTKEYDSVRQKIADTRILDAIQFINSNWDKKLTVGVVAAHVYLSDSRFLHLFKSETGKTFSTFVTEIKIERAKQLLLNSTLSITVISQQLGFYQSSYFSSTFSRVFGMSPSQYRSLYTPKDRKI